MWQTKANSNDSIKQFQHDSYYMCELKWKKIKKKFKQQQHCTERKKRKKKCATAFNLVCISFGFFPLK